MRSKQELASRLLDDIRMGKDNQRTRTCRGLRLGLREASRAQRHPFHGFRSNAEMRF